MDRQWSDYVAVPVLRVGAPIVSPLDLTKTINDKTSLRYSLPKSRRCMIRYVTYTVVSSLTTAAMVDLNVAVSIRKVTSLNDKQRLLTDSNALLSVWTGKV